MAVTWRRRRRRRQRFDSELLPYLGSLYRFARSLAGPSEAEDLVQETCARALGRFEAYAPGTNLRTWLFTLLRNQCIDDHRRMRRERDLESRAVVIPFLGLEDRSLETLLIEHRWSSEIRAALAALPETFRTPIYLKDVEGFRYREIAAVAGCPIGTVMSRLARGRALLRTALLRQAAERGLLAAERRRESG